MWELPCFRGNAYIHAIFSMNDIKCRPVGKKHEDEAVNLIKQCFSTPEV